MTQTPNLDEELALHRAGHRFIAGVDEAGRGAMAGPVVAAAVILPLEVPDALCRTLAGVRDSKQLSPSQRDDFYEVVHANALTVGVGVASPAVIDTVGIAWAAKLAMAGAVSRLGHRPDYLLIDAFELPNPSVPQRAIVRGDQTCLTIAAASIVAKVTRDRRMIDFDDVYPGYRFAQHKGYVTRAHKLALHQQGVCPLHRISYAPVRRALERQRRFGCTHDLSLRRAPATRQSPTRVVEIASSAKTASSK